MLTKDRRRYTPFASPYREGIMSSARRKRPELDVRIEAKGDVVTVTLVGEAHFDFDDADVYIHRVLSHRPVSVIIDASKLRFVSSVGMNLLIHLRRALAATGGTLKLVGLQARVEEAMKNAKVLGMFKTYATLTEALGQATP